MGYRNTTTAKALLSVNNTHAMLDRGGAEQNHSRRSKAIVYSFRVHNVKLYILISIIHTHKEKREGRKKEKE